MKNQGSMTQDGTQCEVKHSTCGWYVIDMETGEIVKGGFCYESDAQRWLDENHPPTPAAIAVADVEQTFGPVCAKLAREHNQWPAADEVIYRLGLIAKYGKRRLKGILAARRRYEAQARAEQFRATFGGSGKGGLR